MQAEPKRKGEKGKEEGKGKKNKKIHVHPLIPLEIWQP